MREQAAPAREIPEKPWNCSPLKDSDTSSDPPFCWGESPSEGRCGPNFLMIGKDSEEPRSPLRPTSILAARNRDSPAQVVGPRLVHGRPVRTSLQVRFVGAAQREALELPPRLWRASQRFESSFRQPALAAPKFTPSTVRSDGSSPSSTFQSGARRSAVGAAPRASLSSR